MDPPLRRDVAIVARCLDWRAGWWSGVGDSRLGSRSGSSGCEEESCSDAFVGRVDVVWDEEPEVLPGPLGDSSGAVNLDAV